MRKLVLLLMLSMTLMAFQCDFDEIACEECYIEYYELNETTQEFEYVGEYECTVDQIGLIRYSSDGTKLSKYKGRMVECE